MMAKYMTPDNWLDSITKEDVERMIPRGQVIAIGAAYILRAAADKIEQNSENKNHFVPGSPKRFQWYDE
jgi:hypothetical protein